MNNKTFLNLVRFGADFKFLLGLYFTFFMTIITLQLYFLQGVTVMPIVAIWQVAGYSLVLTLLHPITRTNLKLIISIAIHSVLVYITTIVFAYFCGWFDIANTNVFWQFTISYIVLYAGIYFGFYLYYKNEEEYLNKKLNEYNDKNRHCSKSRCRPLE